MMTLYMSAGSPYARKCRIVAIERHLTDRVREVPVAPLDNPAVLVAANPLSKVPALDRGDGELALFDSPVIAAYLDSLGEGPGLRAASGPEYWQDLRLEALADGIMDSVVSYRFELSFKTDSIPSSRMVERLTQTVARGFEQLEREAPVWARQYTLGSLAVAVAADYARWRMPQVSLDDLPLLQAWQAQCAARHAFERTRPPAN